MNEPLLKAFDSVIDAFRLSATNGWWSSFSGILLKLRRYGCICMLRFVTRRIWFPSATKKHKKYKKNTRHYFPPSLANTTGFSEKEN